MYYERGYSNTRRFQIKQQMVNRNKQIIQRSVHAAVMHVDCKWFEQLTR